MTNDSLDDQKKVEFYGQTVGAWLTTSFEFDRSLLTLSTLGIGFHLVHIEQSGIATGWECVFVLAASFAFVACIMAVLLKFKTNKSYLEKLVTDPGTENDPALQALDLTAILSFCTAVICSLILVAITVSNAYQEGQKEMSKKEEGRLGLGNESISDLGKMSSEKIDKSANNMGKLSQTSQPSGQPAKPDTSKPVDSGKGTETPRK